ASVGGKARATSVRPYLPYLTYPTYLTLPDPPDLRDLSGLFRRRVLVIVGLRRFRRTRTVHRQADAVPEGIDLPFDLMTALHKILEYRLVPLQARVRDELQPVAARGFVRRLGTAVPERDV